MPQFLPTIATPNPILKPNKNPGNISSGVQGKQNVTPSAKKIVYPMIPFVPADCTQEMNVVILVVNHEDVGGVGTVSESSLLA